MITRHASCLSARYPLGVPKAYFFESICLDTDCTQGVCADRASAIDAYMRQKTSSHYHGSLENQHATTEA